MDSVKLFEYKNDNRYSLVYHTDINECIKSWYWYDDISDVLCEFNCIMISSICIPSKIDYFTGVQFLKEFCDIMTIGNKVIMFDMEELLNIHDIDYVCDVENLLCRSNFINIPVNDTDVYDTYVYINSNGMNLLTMVDAMRGIYYD